MTPTFDQLTVSASLFEPALRLLRNYCRHRRDTPERGGRAVSALGSATHPRPLRFRPRLSAGLSGSRCSAARTTWFGALHSPRRAALVAEVATRSDEVFDRFLQPRDWLGAFPELAGWAVWTVDGHHLAHACHAQRDPKGEFVSVGRLYGLCLHSGLQRALVPFQGNGVRRHEFPVFKQRLPRWLQQDRGEKVPIVVGDPAYIDVLHWAEEKRLRQALIITREKEHMKPTVISQYAFAPQDPVNRGVEADEMAGYTHAYLRRMVYCDPASGERLVFLTTETSLRPGLIALLYLLRWKIEKVFRCLQKQAPSTESLGQRRNRRPDPSASHRPHPQPAHHPACHAGAGRHPGGKSRTPAGRAARGSPRQSPRPGTGNGSPRRPAHLPVHPATAALSRLQPLVARSPAALPAPAGSVSLGLPSKPQSAHR